MQIKKLPIQDHLTQIIQDTFPREYPKLRYNFPFYNSRILIDAPFLPCTGSSVTITYPRYWPWYPNLKSISLVCISPSVACTMYSTILIRVSHTHSSPSHFLFNYNHFLEIRLNLEEGVKMAKDVCNGIVYIHQSDFLVQRFELNPHNVVVS